MDEPLAGMAKELMGCRDKPTEAGNTLPDNIS